MTLVESNNFSSENLGYDTLLLHAEPEHYLDPFNIQPDQSKKTVIQHIFSEKLLQNEKYQEALDYIEKHGNPNEDVDYYIYEEITVFKRFHEKYRTEQKNKENINTPLNHNKIFTTLHLSNQIKLPNSQFNQFKSPTFASCLTYFISIIEQISPTNSRNNLLSNLKAEQQIYRDIFPQAMTWENDLHEVFNLSVNGKSSFGEEIRLHTQKTYREKQLARIKALKPGESALLIGSCELALGVQIFAYIFERSTTHQNKYTLRIIDPSAQHYNDLNNDPTAANTARFSKYSERLRVRPILNIGPVHKDKIINSELIDTIYDAAYDRKSYYDNAEYTEYLAAIMEVNSQDKTLYAPEEKSYSVQNRGTNCTKLLSLLVKWYMRQDEGTQRTHSKAAMFTVKAKSLLTTASLLENDETFKSDADVSLLFRHALVEYKQRCKKLKKLRIQNPLSKEEKTKLKDLVKHNPLSSEEKATLKRIMKENR